MRRLRIKNGTRGDDKEDKAMQKHNKSIAMILLINLPLFSFKKSAYTVGGGDASKSHGASSLRLVRAVALLQT